MWPEVQTAHVAAHFQEMISVGGDVGLASLRIMLGKNVSDNNGSAGLMGCRRGEGRSEHARVVVIGSLALRLMIFSF